jgi:Flp pilus assembly protein TadD
MGLSRRLVSLRLLRYHGGKIRGKDPVRVNRFFIALTFGSALAAPALAQDIEVDTKFKTADTNNAVIEGRVVLPSGFEANRNVRITLRNSVRALATIYTSKQGQFHIDNLSEGIYFVQADVDDRSFEPVTEKVSLGRGIVKELTLELREKKTPLGVNPARVVSVAELRQVVPDAARKEYALGLKSVKEGNIAQAAEHFQQATSIYPEYLAARNDLGAQYLKLKRVDEAEKLFQAVLDGDPKNFNAKFNLGLVRIERKNYLEAISELNQAIIIDSTRPVARLWLGVALLESGDLATAETELTKALVMGGSECVAAHYHLARIYLARGDSTEALRALEAYLGEAPKGEYVTEAKQLENKIKARP